MKNGAMIPIDVVGHESSYNAILDNTPIIKLYDNEYVHLYKSGNIFMLDLPMEIKLFREISKGVITDLANILYKYMFIDKLNIDELTIYTWNIKENIIKGIYAYVQQDMTLCMTHLCGRSAPKQIIEFMNEIIKEWHKEPGIKDDN